MNVNEKLCCDDGVEMANATHYRRIRKFVLILTDSDACCGYFEGNYGRKKTLVEMDVSTDLSLLGMTMKPASI